MRYLHRNDVARQAGEIGEESARILARHHAGDHHERTRDPLFEIAKRGSDDPSALGIVTAVEPDLGPPRSPFDQPARSEPLHSRGPFGIDDTLERGVAELDRL